MVISVYRGVNVVATFKPDQATYGTELSGRNEITAKFTLNTPFAFELGDHIVFESSSYFLNTMPDVVKVSSNKYEYTASFESILYDLAKIMFMFSERSDFEFNGTLRNIVDLISINIERAYSADHIEIGEVEGIAPYMYRMEQGILF